MASILFTLLSLFVLLNCINSTEIDVNGIAIENFQASGSLDNVEILIQEEAQVVNALIELDNQLGNALDHVSSASGAVEIDVVVEESGNSKTGSGFQIEDEIVVIIPAGSRLSNEEKNEIKEEIENEVANTLDEIIVNEIVSSPEMEQKPQEGGSLPGMVERLFEQEAEAEKELENMQEELEKALDEIPSKGPLTEVDVVVTELDDQQEVIDDEIIVIFPSSTGSGPRLTEQEKEILEEEIVKETADALGKVIMDDFVRNEPEKNSNLELPASPRLHEDSPRENMLVQRTSAPFADEAAVQGVSEDVAKESELKPALRGASPTSTAHTGFKHPMFVPNHWQMPPDEQLWMKLSMLTSMSCLTLLLIVGVWTGVRRSRRVILNDSTFRWAEAVEYMDAYPYES